jgi:hypothetical protein
MLDFYSPQGYHVRIYGGDSIYVSDATEGVVAIYTPNHGDLIYPDLLPSITVERREALEYGKQWLRDRNSRQSRN